MQVESSIGRASVLSATVSALQAFWPALGVLAGEVAAAREDFRPLRAIWRRHRALPEMWDLDTGAPVSYAADAPLRPELIEAALSLFGATGAPEYVRFGAAVLTALNDVSRVPCGYAAVGNMMSGHLDDRMVRSRDDGGGAPTLAARRPQDSYFLSETAKYLFMLFDGALLPEGHGVFYDARLGCAGGGTGDCRSHRALPERHFYVGAADNRTALCEALACGSGAAVSCCAADDCDEGVFLCRSTPLPPRGLRAEDAAGALPLHRRLALRVRSGRSAFAAAPLRWAEYVLSTEGHMFALRGVVPVRTSTSVLAARSRVWRYEPPMASRAAVPAGGGGGGARRECATVDRYDERAAAEGVHAAAPAATPPPLLPTQQQEQRRRPGRADDGATGSVPASDGAPPALAVRGDRCAGGGDPGGLAAVWAADMGVGGTFVRVLVSCVRRSGVAECDARAPLPFAQLDVSVARSGGAEGFIVEASPAMFGPRIGATGVTGPMVVAVPADACGAMDVAAVAGAVVVAARGGCSFVAKAVAVGAAGARALLVLDDGGEDGPSVMADDGSGRVVGVPCALLGSAGAAAVRQRLAGGGAMGWLHEGPAAGRVTEALGGGGHEMVRAVEGVLADAVAAADAAMHATSAGGGA